jgi:hypothetical protein
MYLPDEIEIGENGEIHKFISKKYHSKLLESFINEFDLKQMITILELSLKSSNYTSSNPYFKHTESLVYKYKTLLKTISD